LPAIMKWLKQVFAQRYNRAEGRIGHIWGDRYGSRIVEGEPTEEEITAVGERNGASNAGVRPRWGETNNGVRPWYGDSTIGVRPRYGETVIQTTFPPLFPLLPAPAPG
ncbi:MAG: transposase, partial [Spirochaetaceae bacterium]|nr:transposase [Spirochaetaceae bacterium]